MGKLFFLIVFSIYAVPSYGQSASVSNGVEGMRSYVANLEERLKALADDYSSLSADYADLDSRYQALNTKNKNILNCAKRVPPEIYVDGIGCDPIAIEPCTLCDADGNEVEPADAAPAASN